jgi:hypothetical protein
MDKKSFQNQLVLYEDIIKNKIKIKINDSKLEQEQIHGFSILKDVSMIPLSQNQL